MPSLSSVRDLFTLLREKPSIGMGEAGRARERARRVALTTLSALAVRALGMATSLISVPLSLHYLERERYGLWLSLTSMVAMFGFVDLGLGNGLLNCISRAHGEDDRNAARVAVSSTLTMLSSISLVIGLGFAIAYQFIDWRSFFNLQSAAAQAEAGPAAVVIVVGFLLGLPLGVVQTIRAGYQEAYVNAMWAVGGNLFGLAGLVACAAFKAPLPLLVFAVSGGPLIGTVGNSVQLFFRDRPWLIPSLKSFSKVTALAIFKTGLMFLTLQIAVGLAFNSDNMVIAQQLGSQAVVEYGIAARLFAVVSSLVVAFLSPLWPAYGESIARGDIAWVRATLRRSLWLSAGITGAISLVLVPAGPAILRLWTRSDITVSWVVLAGLATWMVLSSVGNALAMYMNAENRVRFQVVTAVFLTGLALALKYLLVRGFGVEGLAWATVLAYIPTTAIPSYFFMRRSLRELSERKPTVEVARASG